MKGKKISTRTLRLRGVGLIVTCAFGMLGPLPSEAQQKRNMEDRMATLTKASNKKADIPKIGYIRNVSKPTSVDDAFWREMLDLGYVRDHNIFIMERFAGGNPAKLKQSVDELLNEKVDVIVALSPPATRELLLPERRKADRGIPLVIRSDDQYHYKKPGKNITGLVEINNTPALFGKRLQLLKEVAKLSHLLLVFNSTPNAIARYGNSGTVANTLKLDTRLKFESLDVTDISLLESFFQKNFRNSHSPYSNGLIVVRNAFILENKEKIFKLADEYKTPAIYTDREFVEAGGLMSYGTDEADLFRQAASYVDRILKGTKPEAIPMRQAIRFELSINLLTAKQMGLEIPPTTLMLADKVVK